MKHQGTPTTGTPDLMETPFTEGTSATTRMPTKAGRHVRNTSIAEAMSIAVGIADILATAADLRDINSSENNSSRDTNNSREHNKSWNLRGTNGNSRDSVAVETPETAALSATLLIRMHQLLSFFKN
jgi:hypothetical protein